MDVIGSRRVYLDANIIIYGLEGSAAFAEELQPLFNRISSGAQSAVTSELTLAETLVRPLADSHAEYERMYRRVLQTRGTFKVAPISRTLLIEAARIRATEGDQTAGRNPSGHSRPQRVRAVFE